MVEAAYTVGVGASAVCAFARVAVVAIIGLVLIVWTLLSWRGLFVGHGILEDQELVTRGPTGSSGIRLPQLLPRLRPPRAG